MTNAGNDIFRGKSALVVDDMGALRVLVSGLLRNTGMDTHEARSGREAMSLILSRHFDAFVLDIRMPDMSGIELCRLIRSMEGHRNTPVIFISSLEETSALTEALEAGGDDFIGKPVQFVVLRARLRNLLQRAALLNEERMMSLSLQRYVSPRTEEIARLYASTGTLPAPKRQEVCVLFSDVRRFTELSQEIEPEILFRVLSRHLAMLVSQVYRHGGYVDKFSGDGLMAVFDGEDMAGRCCECALDMVDESRELLVNEDVPIHQMGIGIHRGDAVLGNLGSTRHLDYTIIGKSVNLAARLCAMADSLSIVVSESVRDGLVTRRGMKFDNERRASVRGFREPIAIWDLMRGE